MILAEKLGAGVLQAPTQPKQILTTSVSRDFGDSGSKTRFWCPPSLKQPKQALTTGVSRDFGDSGGSKTATTSPNDDR